MLLYFSKVKLTQNSTSVLLPFHLATHVPRHALPCQWPCKPQSRTPPMPAQPCDILALNAHAPVFLLALAWLARGSLALCFHFTLHLPISHTYTFHFPLAATIFSLPLCLSLWMHHFVEFNKQGGWLAREALLLHVHVAYGSCLLLRTHVAYGPLLLRTRVAYGICLCYCVPVLHTGFALLLLTLVA